ncbi:MAG: NAD-dependent epimerase/dehydratase family protein [Patescibacteria group bacterium]|nr:NAD-dependent epimerase/dehydratase family protein [Patescibacteria group bacterium]
MTKILIVGGTGFIGQHLIEELQTRGYDISVICRKRRYGEYIDIERIPGVKIFYNVDILDYPALGKYFKDIGMVVNLGGLVSFRQKDKEELEKNNCQGALNVLRACENNSVKKLIHLSSTAALGFSDKIIDENFCFDWADNKRCVYSHSKSLADSEIKKGQVGQIIIYSPLVLGPGDKKNTRQLIDAVKDKKLPFNPPGRNSYVDVRDLVSAIILLLDKDIKNESFIVASENFSFKELNSVIAKELNSRPPVFTAPKFMAPLASAAALFSERLFKNSPLTYENVFMSFKERVHSSEKIRQLGWAPKYNLSQTIKDAINSIK